MTQRRSANRWTAGDRSLIASYALPGGRIALRKGDVSVVLLWCASRWHETVEPLVWPGVWGYADRLVRGSSSTLSDHASGTAIDINAPEHPLGVAVDKTFTTLERRAIRAILEYCEGVVGWGGDYERRPDGMHLFIRADAKAVKRIADKIRAQADRAKVAPTPVKVAASPVEDQPATISPLAAYREDDCMLIKTQPDKSKPGTLTALLSGPMFIGLGPTESPSDEQAAKMGLPVLWVEYGTWQDMDRRSHNLCDNPRPVVTQAQVVRSANRINFAPEPPSAAQEPSSQRPPSATHALRTEPEAPSSPNSPSPS
jgi:D-alanyl-D-alanine carboxypeptidase